MAYLKRVEVLIAGNHYEICDDKGIYKMAVSLKLNCIFHIYQYY